MSRHEIIRAHVDEFVGAIIGVAILTLLALSDWKRLPILAETLSGLARWAEVEPRDLPPPDPKT